MQSLHFRGWFWVQAVTRSPIWRPRWGTTSIYLFSYWFIFVVIYFNDQRRRLSVWAWFKWQWTHWLHSTLWKTPPPSTNIHIPDAYLLKDKIKALLQQDLRHPDHLQAEVEIRRCQPGRRSSADDVCLAAWEGCCRGSGLAWLSQQPQSNFSCSGSLQKFTVFFVCVFLIYIFQPWRSHYT